jgi:hypothetical protein
LLRVVRCAFGIMLRLEVYQAKPMDLSA